MQAPCKLGGYLQKGRGGPAGSPHTRPAGPTVMNSCDGVRSHAMCCDRVVIDVQMIAHLLLGGGLGLGVPVVSYAPRPMIISVLEEVLVIIAKDVRNCATDGSAYNVHRGVNGGMQVAQGLTHLEQGQRSTGVGQTDSLRGTNRLRAIARTGRLVGAFGSRQYLVISVLGMDAALDAGMRRGKNRAAPGAMDGRVQRSVKAVKARAVTGEARRRVVVVVV